MVSPGALGQVPPGESPPAAGEAGLAVGEGAQSWGFRCEGSVLTLRHGWEHPYLGVQLRTRIW